MLIDYESYIPIGSKIVGRTIKEVEAKFGLKIDHCHNSPIDIQSKTMPVPDMILNPGMSIKIRDADSIVLAKFRQYFDLP